MASYPDAVVTPRAIENRAGVVYDANDTKTLFAEDIENINAEIVAIETDLGLNPEGVFNTVAERLDDLSYDSKTETLTNKTIDQPILKKIKVRLSSGNAYSDNPQINYDDEDIIEFARLQNFTNLSTTPVYILEGGATGAGFFDFCLTNIDGDKATFRICVGVEAGVIWKFLHVLGANCAITESSEGVFAISGLGDGRTYTLTCSTGASQMTLKASSTATGTTKLYCKAVVFGKQI